MYHPSFFLQLYGVSQPVNRLGKTEEIFQSLLHCDLCYLMSIAKVATGHLALL